MRCVTPFFILTKRRGIDMKLKDTGLTAKELKDMVKKYMVETYPRYDFIAERAEGMYLYDEKGEAYLDFYGGVAVNSPGNRNPKVVAAVKDQMDDIMHTFNYPYTVPQALLSKKICDTIGMDKIFYQNSGTEANECMIKMARKYGIDNYGPDRYEIITAKEGFHGRTFGSMSATGQPDSAIHKGFGPMVPGFVYAEYNNLEDFASKVTKNTIAIMIEPVQGEGGVHPATQEFMEGLRKLCDDNDMLLLLDEVQTGWGRTGAPMAYMGYGVKPDAVSMAKAMGGGMPIGACCARKEVAAALGAGTHGSTYGGHPVACAAALASVSEILDNHLSENAKEVGAYFVEKLAKLPHVVEARGRGLLVGCEYDIPIAMDVKWNTFKRHALITAIGDNINRMIPPLTATKEDVDQVVEIMKAAIEEAVKKAQAA
jgi:acetylornithine/N-succinyldiaminopimelate aminotransferase